MTADEAPEAESADAKFVLIKRDEDADTYAVLDEMVNAFHADDLAEAKIALVWAHEVPEDRDGIAWWGKAKKVSSAERAFHDNDFVIFLNAEIWKQLETQHRRALMDHELMHCNRYETEDGETKYRIRKHDLEEFNDIVRRHGLWRASAKTFVDAALGREGGDSSNGELFSDQQQRNAVAAVDELRRSVPSGVTMTIEHAGKTATIEGAGKPRKEMP